MKTRMTLRPAVSMDSLRFLYSCSMEREQHLKVNIANVLFNLHTRLSFCEGAIPSVFSVSQEMMVFA